ncbi:MAG: hypothetical protein AAB908_01495 [Patescibacteria group bacterium]
MSSIDNPSEPTQGSKEYWQKQYEKPGNYIRLLAEAVLEHAPKVGKNLSVNDIPNNNQVTQEAENILAQGEGKLSRSDMNELAVLLDVVKHPKK